MIFITHILKIELNKLYNLYIHYIIYINFIQVKLILIVIYF